MIKLTEIAKQKIKEFAISEDLPTSIRPKIIGGGCAGFSFDLTFDNAANPLDEVVIDDEIQILIDPLSSQYLEDSTIDYIETSFGGGFKFISPNVKNTCGCESSFSF